MAALSESPAAASVPGRLLDRIAGSNLLALAALLVAAFLAFAPGFTGLPPMDRDEPRFAQASKQMLESGDYVSIRFQDEARLKKPVGIYWLQTAAVSLGASLGVPEARTTIWLYRIPSLIAAIGAVLLTWWTALPLAGRRAALLAGLTMAGCLLLGVEARLAKTDATQLLTVMAMVGVLARFFMASRRGEPAPAGLALPAVFWLGMAASILIKGPIGALLVGLTIGVTVAATRDWRWLGQLRWLWGILFTLVLVSPWFIAIMIETKGAFLQESVGKDMLNKVAGAQESHGGWPGTYLAVFWGTFWPFAPLAALAAPWVWHRRRQPAVIFLLAWLVPFWLVFEFFPTKLPHYVLPVYPAIAILIAMAVFDDGLSRSRWARFVAGLIPLLALVLAVVAVGAVWFYQREIAWLTLPFAILAVAAAWLAWRRLGEGRGAEAVLACLATSLLLYWGIYAGAIPKLQAMAISPRLAAAVQTEQCPHVSVASVGFREPSLVFLAGTDLDMPTPEGAADFLAQGTCRAAFVDKRFEPAFLARLAANGTKVDLASRVAGININGGKKLDIGVYRNP
ncbi:glycosyltransferase family 39 protein [Labrys sp. KNU-23]|uniref:ArnT family glycosyltransferase n=1 Tax=Labrys sp. KNU-23 TaxID=2789216 RepID=UPI0011EF6D9C|nr:glycosyltransferase family 39 protein [Labrys sp. KNU-23]QEN86723.1 glycosyltransferase family 39 protein [Labrys sp. KNU-23]